MTLSTTLQLAARSLISTFGNTATLYPYASATKSENEEGDVAVSSWGAGSSIKTVDGDNAKEILTQVTQGIETLGDDEKLVMDNVTILINDRFTEDSVNYRVVTVRPVRTQDTIVVKGITVAREDITSQW